MKVPKCAILCWCNGEAVWVRQRFVWLNRLLGRLHVPAGDDWKNYVSAEAPGP